MECNFSTTTPLLRPWVLFNIPLDSVHLGFPNKNPNISTILVMLLLVFELYSNCTLLFYFLNAQLILDQINNIGDSSIIK